jgi:hypothetical protein
MLCASTVGVVTRYTLVGFYGGPERDTPVRAAGRGEPEVPSAKKAMMTTSATDLGNCGRQSECGYWVTSYKRTIMFIFISCPYRVKDIGAGLCGQLEHMGHQCHLPARDTDQTCYYESNTQGALPRPIWS